MALIISNDYLMVKFIYQKEVSVWMSAKKRMVNQDKAIKEISKLIGYEGLLTVNRGQYSNGLSPADIDSFNSQYKKYADNNLLKIQQQMPLDFFNLEEGLYVAILVGGYWDAGAWDASKKAEAWERLAFIRFSEHTFIVENEKKYSGEVIFFLRPTSFRNPVFINSSYPIKDLFEQLSEGLVLIFPLKMLRQSSFINWKTNPFD
jgi:hypothetical protein